MINHPTESHPIADMSRGFGRILLAMVILVVLGGAAAAVTPETTPVRPGGNIFFESSPSGATIWLDGTKIGTTPFTYFSEKNGTLQVVAQKRLFENYTGIVTVEDGSRVVFRALMTPVSGAISGGDSPVVVISTAEVPERRSTVTLPTPWPSPTTESPLDPAIGIGAVALSIGLLAARQRR